MDFQPLAPGLGRGYNAYQMDIDQKYQATLDYLYSFIDYSLQKTSRYSPDKFDLGRMHEFMAALGNPQREYKILHVAGTKGKGSVSALCAQAIQESGIKVGLYTSPHLQDYAERIQIDGIQIPHHELINLVEELKPTIAASAEITTFEITTALAFLYFARCEVNAAVIEVGLGGRLDATNVCDPEVTIITSISYDHTYLLGETLAEIAGEKAGIIKPGVPVVVSPQKDEALQVIKSIAEEQGAPIIRVGKDFLYQQVDKSLAGQSLLIWHVSDQSRMDNYISSGQDGDWEPVRLRIPLLGVHQLENAATAFAALQIGGERGIEISDVGIRRGFRNVNWPGRFEILRQDPPLIIDCAHNRDSAQKLYQVIEEFYPGRPVILVFGASEDKDIRGMFAELRPRISQIVATKSTHPRAIDPGELVELAKGLECPVIVTSSVEEALVEAELLAGGDTLILVTGSIFVAAAARAVWQSRIGEVDKSQIGSKT